MFFYKSDSRNQLISKNFIQQNIPLLICGGLLWTVAAQLPAAEVLRYQVDEVAHTRQVPRIGLNLGNWTTWGAAQLPRNILKNPGFEGNIDRALIIVGHADWQGFSDDATWTKRPDGFWARAHYDVRTGIAAGSGGELFDSLARDKSGFPKFITLGVPPLLAPGDVISLTRVDDHSKPASWWYGKEQLPVQVRVNTKEHRPGSPGLRSLVLQPMMQKPASVIAYWDTIGDRAGKLLPVIGQWRLAFWMRRTPGDASLQVQFKRLTRQPVFFERTFTPNGQWRLFEYVFQVDDTGPPATLALQFTARGDTGEILLDDVEFGPVASGENSAFRSEVIEALQRLRPGYLRDWQGQLGDTLTNRLAPVFARRTSRYRPGDDIGFYYGVEEFLQLCRQVGAQPWLIIPTTFSDKELQQWGQYLAEKTQNYGFTEVVLEFGNENWNSLFRPAGIQSITTHGQAANRAFRMIKAGAKNNKIFRYVVNGQFVNPAAALKTLDSVTEADALAVAPYFLFKLDQKDRTNPWPLLFAEDRFLAEEMSGVKKRKKQLAVYEVNLHTMQGDAGSAFRNQLVTGAASGAALAKRLMDALNLGVTRQCVYQFAQYDAWTENNAQSQRELAKLWGIVRDLGDTRRFRPTGLAMVMLNRVLPGDIHNVKPVSKTTKPGITLTAFHQDDAWALAVVSSVNEPRELEVGFPLATGKLPQRILRLDSSGPAANNEREQQVRLLEEKLPEGKIQDASVRFKVPAYGVVVLLGGD